MTEIDICMETTIHSVRHKLCIKFADMGVCKPQSLCTVGYARVVERSKKFDSIEKQQD